VFNSDDNDEEKKGRFKTKQTRRKRIKSSQISCNFSSYLLKSQLMILKRPINMVLVINVQIIFTKKKEDFIFFFRENDFSTFFFLNQICSLNI